MTGIPQPGTTLAGKFVVEQVLGKGGMGVVVAAQHLQLRQRVAIKFLLPDALRNAEVVKRFEREARAAAKIRGEHVARVIDVGQLEDGAPFMVMEYLDGRDLASMLEERGPLPVEDVVRYVLEACEALAEAHVAKIVHRDLKPSNLFLTERPDKRAIIKVLDFGISKFGDASTVALTSPTSIVGTAYYMSPEQLSSPNTVDHRSDIWSLGIILYELLTGVPPFRGNTVPEVVAGILKNQPRPVRELRADVPVGLERVVGKCLQAAVADRYQDVAELAEALAPFGGADRTSVEVTVRVLGRKPSIPAPPEAITADGLAASASVTSPPRSRVTTAVTIALAASVLVVAGGFITAFALRKTAEPAPPPSALVTSEPPPFVPSALPSAATTPAEPASAAPIASASSTPKTTPRPTAVAARTSTTASSTSPAPSAHGDTNILRDTTIK